MKTIAIAFGVLVAVTTIAQARSAEKHCWSKVTRHLENRGCQFGNDFAPDNAKCLRVQKFLYNRCLLHANGRAQAIQRIGPVNSLPTNRTTNLRYK